MLKYYVLLFTTLLITSCVEPINDSFTKLPPGIWRGVLLIDDNDQMTSDDVEFEKKTDFSGELPFNFEVVYDSEEEFHLVFKNADETIIVDSIDYGRDKATAKDTLTIHFVEYETYIKAIYEENIIEGYWYVPYKGDYQIPFKAYQGQDHRFKYKATAPKYDISGKWETYFKKGTEDEYSAIAEFDQDGNKLTGTVMTETGDYRYLDGYIADNKFKLSTFDGTHAYLFEGKLPSEDAIIGGFRSGKHYKSYWESIRNEDFVLADPFNMTEIVDGDKPFYFDAVDLDGNSVKITDEKFDNKVKLVKISGTWCPNCKDEMNFLKDYFSTHSKDDVEIIEINFERYEDDQRNIKTLKSHQSRLDFDVNVLYGGRVSAKMVKEKLPQIAKVLSYPTLLFIDQNNMIRYVHTGFAGPATSEYKNFERKFDKLLNQLIQEKTDQ